MIRINNFPTFVTSKAVFDTKRINAYGTEWFVKILLCKYCQTNKVYIPVTPSSIDPPETLGAFVCGMRRDRKECSFDVDATFKFKQPATASEYQLSHKFSFNSTKYYETFGFPQIDVNYFVFFCQLII